MRWVESQPGEQTAGGTLSLLSVSRRFPSPQLEATRTGVRAEVQSIERKISIREVKEKTVNFSVQSVPL